MWEKGFQVLGLGEAKTPDTFEKVCSRFVQVENGNNEKVTPPPVVPKLVSDKVLNKYLTKLINENPIAQGMQIGQLGSKMYSRYDVQISKRSDKTWTKYLKKYPTQFDCFIAEKEARVRIVLDN